MRHEFVVTVILTGAEVAVIPPASFATAVRLYEPTGTFFHSRVDHAPLVLTPRDVVPAKYSIEATRFVK